MLMMMEAEELAEEMLMQNSTSTEKTIIKSEDTTTPDKDLSPEKVTGSEESSRY